MNNTIYNLENKHLDILPTSLLIKKTLPPLNRQSQKKE